MSHRTLAVGIVVLLIVSMLIAFAPARAPAASAASAAPVSGTHTAAQPAATTITASLINGEDELTTYFYPGSPGYGSLYFSVNDPSDSAVNVTITDPNAARDGVPTPAFSYMATLNTTTHTYTSYPSGASYKFPSNLSYGGAWKVNFSAPKGGYLDINVSVILYYTTLTTTVGTGSTLPGQPIGVFWQLPLDANGGTLYTHATSVTFYGHYTGNGTTQNLTAVGGILLPSPGLGHGEWTGTVPANAAPASVIHIEVSAVTNVSGQVVENESANITVHVGTLVVHGVGITGLPPNCVLTNDVEFAAGSVIASCIQAGSTYGAVFTPISGLPVTVQYWNGTAHVSPVGAPTSLTTNATGEAGFTFLANIPPFSDSYTSLAYNALNFTVNLTGAGTYYHWTVWDNVTWELFPTTIAQGIVQVTLDHSTYYVGSTGTATWSVSSLNLTLTGPITAILWEVTGSGAITFEQGVLNTTGSAGSFTFAILPSMATKEIYVYVVVANATSTFRGLAEAAVVAPALLLTPSNYYYDAGSTDPVTVVLTGGATGATIQYQVWAYWSDTSAMIGNGTVANNSNIPVSIASIAPDEVVVSAWATVGSQVVASQTADVYLAEGYSVLLGVGTMSSYSDGSFQPGQTVTLNYQVVSVGGAALPQRVSFELVAEGFPYYQRIPNVGTSGSISFTVPSDAPQGALLLGLVVTSDLGTGTCFPTGGCEGFTSLTVNPNPSVLNLELGAGSGLTVGWLILLILIVVVAVVLFLVIRRGRGGSVRPSSTSSGTSSSPPEEWQGPTPPTPAPSDAPAPSPGPSSSDSPPPLPPPSQPPAGSS